MSTKPLRSLRLGSFTDTSLDSVRGNRGEVYYDSSQNCLRVLDGAVTGGYSLARADLDNVTDADFVAKVTAAGALTWSAISGKPTFAAVATTGSYSDLSGKPSLATVATTGSYTDLANKPYYFTDLESIQFEAGVAVSEFSSDGAFTDNSNTAVPTEAAVRNYIDRRLGFTHTGDSVAGGQLIGSAPFATESYVTSRGYITGVSWSAVTGKPTFATVATSGSYADLTNKPTAFSNLSTVSMALGVQINEFSSDTTLGGNSNTAVPTEAAVKSYVDTAVSAINVSGSINTLSDVDTVTTAPTVGQVLKWNGTNWVPAADATAGGAGLDADTLDGLDSSYFLNYANLSGTPNLASYALANNPSFTGNITIGGVTSTGVTGTGKLVFDTSPTFTGTVSGITAAMVGLGNVTNESKATMFTSATFTGTTNTAAISSSSTISDSKGELRSVPLNSQAGSYTLVEADHGKCVSAGAGVTVPASVFSAGQSTVIYNNTSGNITVTQGGGVTMYFAGTATTGNRTLAQRGLATVLCVASNTFVISGSGLT